MKKSKESCDLNTCLLCKLCHKEWKAAIGAHRTKFKVAKGELIFSENQEVKGIYFVYEGTVKVHKHWGDKELILRFAKKGNIIGHRGLGNNLVYPVSATAMGPAALCYVDLNFFESSLKVNHNFLYELMHFFASELKESERNMRNLAHMTVKGRIAQALLTMEEKFGCDDDGFINLSISRQDLASFAGTTYETVFRVLSEFVEEKLIKIEGKKIKTVDKSGLSISLK